MGYSRYIGRVGALAVALGIGAALGATPWLASAEPSTSGSSAHSASTAPSSDSSSAGAATSRTGAVSGKSDSTPPTASGSTRKSTKSPIGQVTSKSASDTSSGSSQPATRSAEPGAVVSTDSADTDSPAGSSRSAGTAATTAAAGSEPDSTDATAPAAQHTTAPARSGTTAAKTTRSAAAANTHAARTRASASSVDATRVVADAVQTPTLPIVSAAASTPVPTAATMDIAPDVSDSPRPAATATAAAVTTPVNTVAEIVSSVVDAVLSPIASGTAPGEPAQTPALWTLAAFARREFERAFSNPEPTVNPVASPITNGLVIGTPTLTGLSIDPALTGGTAPLADASVLSANPQPTATAAPATFTGQPSIVSQVFTEFYRVLGAVGDALGVDLATPLFHLLSSDSPPWFTTLGLNLQRSEFEGMPVWTLQSPGATSEKTVVAIPGSAFIFPPTIFHWLNYAAMARNTGATVIVPIYPLVPQGGTAGTVVPAMEDLISAQIDQHGAESVSVYGDSLGGTIGLAAVQELVRRGDPVPSHMVLISPALDLTFSNPAIQFVDDPVLGPLLPSGHKNAQLWAGDLDLTDPLVSPLFGSLAGLPPTAVYFGNLDILAPDGLVLQDNALATPGADFTFILRKGEIHIWAVNTILPETQAVLPDIYQQLGIGSDASPTLSGQSMDAALTGPVVFPAP